MAVSTITIEGFEKTRTAVVRAPDQARALLQTAVSQTAFSASQRAIALAPRDTGLLRSSIRASSRGLSARVVVEPAAFYWRFIEFGTKYRPATPFVRPAAEMESSAFVERVRGVGEAVERSFATSRFL